MKRALIPLTALILGACAFAARDSGPTRGMSDEVARSVRRAAESHTLSRLAALERSLNDYIQAKGRIPAKLSELVPEFIAEIPETELGLRDHKDSSEVVYYPPQIIVGGGIDGPRLDDTGGWGYAFNERQVIVFVDCTHARMDGAPWYKARGVY